MKFSVIIRGQHLQGEDIRARHREEIEQAKLAAKLGYYGIAKGSHFSAHPFQYLQMIPFLSRVAAEAPGLKLICGLVILSLPKPLDIAEQLASLDVISDGNLIFGCALGYRDVEFKAFNTIKKDSGRRFEEALAEVKRLWSNEFVTSKGSHFEHDNANCSVMPLQKPYPPIWIGGGNNKAIQRAATMGDTWYLDPFKTIGMVEEQLPIYRAALDAANKPFPDEFPMMREIFVARTREEAVKLAKPSLKIKFDAYAAWGQDKTDPSNPLNQDFDDLAKDRFLIGSANEVVEQILDLHRRIGVNHLVLGIHWPGMEHEIVADQMRLLSEEVFPAVSAAL
jgi:alkanesulfonate monooxygenase SsuD/methylene tetrahydromethanopterin reductase-like flavin-dependent oxidoreductase (luciferase family)